MVNAVEIDMDTIVVSLWNYAAEEDNRIYFNDPGFFENFFENAYDAAWAVSIGNWCRTDSFVCFDGEGCLVSFTHWDDDKSPIDIDKLDISQLINRLRKRNRYTVNSIPEAIHNALE